MARRSNEVRGMMLVGLLFLALAAGGCSAKNGAPSDQPPPKGGCSLWGVRIFS